MDTLNWTPCTPALRWTLCSCRSKLNKSQRTPTLYNKLCLHHINKRMTHTLSNNKHVLCLSFVYHRKWLLTELNTDENTILPSTDALRFCHYQQLAPQHKRSLAPHDIGPISQIKLYVQFRPIIIQDSLPPYFLRKVVMLASLTSIP